ncbi:hypothetical protein BD289DRAFT_422057 [Coniella lustricola]|uniref:Uncharacterized protein n=1 Tax=Coniella lustricola TaxID=2025994 RepID=A0A2T3AL91_9PEZI|nr:hypothetical protein BD289DRAFT_422057 [Coniella lustricola]
MLVGERPMVMLCLATWGLCNRTGHLLQYALWRWIATRTALRNPQRTDLPRCRLAKGGTTGPTYTDWAGSL